jgi:hypothetical protein
LTGHDYLKKIIQLPVNMPLWQSDDINSYIASLLENYPNTEFKEFLDKNNIELIKTTARSNLGEIKRFLNIFIFNYKILHDYVEPTYLLAIQALAHRWRSFYEKIFSNELFPDRVYKKLYDKDVEDRASELLTSGDRQTLTDLMSMLDKDKDLEDFLKVAPRDIFHDKLLERWIYQTIVKSYS